MSAFRSVTQGFRNLWGQGGDDDYDDVAPEFEDTPRFPRQSASSSSLDTSGEADYSAGNRFSTESHLTESRSSEVRSSEARPSESRPSEVRGADAERYPRYTAPPTSSPSSDSSSSSSGARRARLTSMPLRSREKNIYTLKPKSMDEASLAADYLKTGCAVVLNLEEVERMVAIRIIDFMSGVCYGLEHQGHAMKLGDVIFLFTPGDFEISSDEVDYGENPDILFKDVHHEKLVAPKTVAKIEEVIVAPIERRSWER